MVRARKRIPPKPVRRLKRLSARERWLAVLERFSRGLDEPQSARIWAPVLETASRARIAEIQEEKLRALIPFLYEESAFYRERLRAAKLTPADIRSISDLPKIPVV